MHLKNGKIVGDTAEESLVVAEAEIVGTTPWTQAQYPRHPYWAAPGQYRLNLINTLENEPRDGQEVVVRGLSRIAMSQQKLSFVALDVLTQLADITIKPE